MEIGTVKIDVMPYPFDSLKGVIEVYGQLYPLPFFVIALSVTFGEFKNAVGLFQGDSPDWTLDGVPYPAPKVIIGTVAVPQVFIVTVLEVKVGFSTAVVSGLS